ncbi:MAG: sigma-70 family RNA polymerase sigma factor [Micrococcales bacterium]|nr:sigma-70 family RNA polymerase sigma factor [Micrococcales bacterium]
MLADQERRRRFAALAGATLEPARRYLARRIDPASAEDVLSEVLLVCWRRLDDVPADPLPWVIVVARNCLRNAERAARRRGRLTARLAAEAAAGAPLQAAEPAPEVLAVREALAALRPADAELLRLWAWEGLAPAQLAVVLGISPNATAIRLHRAKRAFAAAVGASATRPPRKATTASGHSPVAVHPAPRPAEDDRADPERGRA